MRVYITTLLQTVTNLLTTMTEPRITPQEFQPAQWPKQKQEQPPMPSIAST
jgi:hypothetical protein